MNSFLKGFKEQGENISILVNSILLFIVYIVGIGITSLILKLFRKEFLSMKKYDESYFEDLNLGKKEYDEYLKQY